MRKYYGVFNTRNQYLMEVYKDKEQAYDNARIYNEQNNSYSDYTVIEGVNNMIEYAGTTRRNNKIENKLNKEEIRNRLVG